MKFNMGCGMNKLPDHINVDSAPASAADQIWNLETLPWPWPDDCAEEVMFNHSLEHMGAQADVFLGIMKELYRIGRDGCLVRINVPHPRHDDFIGDPTHVRPVTPQMLTLFDRRLNEQWRDGCFANTPMAIYLGVDFELVSQSTILAEPYASRYRAGELSAEEAGLMVRERLNIASEYRIVLRIRKPPPAA